MATVQFLWALLCLGVFGFEAVTAQKLTVNVTSKGDYTISRQDGTVWLRSAPTFFIVNWMTYSAADSTLTLKWMNQTTDKGYVKHNLFYVANKTNIVASIYAYTSGEIGFSVTYPEADPLTLTKGGTADNVISGFPGFQIDPPPARLAYMSYGMSSLEAAVGRWENGSAVVYGGRQGSGPLVLFDHNSNAIAMGPSSSFTVTSLWHDVKGTAVYWGIMGAVTQVPAGFQYSVLVVDGGRKVGDAVKSWGAAVRGMTSAGVDRMRMTSLGVRHGVSSSSDSILDAVGYWTGPGSAYYSGPEAGKTYEQTLFDVRLDASNTSTLEPRVDYLYQEIDDWWYEKGQAGGVKNWTAPPSVLPHGVAGLGNKTRWSVAAACGTWAPDTVYSKTNGGQYNFTAGTNCSLPVDQAFWEDLFKQAVEDWIRIFVQKDMEQQYMCMTSGDVDVTMLETWLSQLNVSATNHGLELVYSGALPRMVMEAAFRHTATLAVQVGPGPDNLTDASVWKVGVANIFLNALSLRPFYGIIRSYSRSEPPSDTELSPMMNSLLATLTGGPVAIGDQIGKSDRSLIERCCSAEGQVLSPTVPGRPIDDQLQEIAWGAAGGRTLGDVWTAYTATPFNTDQQPNFFQGVIAATAMTRQYNITPTLAGLVFPPTTASGDKVYNPSKLFSYDNPYILHDFSDQTPFTLSGCTAHKFCLYYVAPVVTFKGKQVVVMGDLTKWVPMSPQRVLNVKVTDTIQVTTRGQPDEKVYIWFHVDDRLQSLEHRIGLDGTGLIKYELPHTDSSACKMAATGTCYVLSLCVCVLAFVMKMW